MTIWWSSWVRVKVPNSTRSTPRLIVEAKPVEQLLRCWKRASSTQSPTFQPQTAWFPARCPNAMKTFFISSTAPSGLVRKKSPVLYSLSPLQSLLQTTAPTLFAFRPSPSIPFLSLPVLFWLDFEPEKLGVDAVQPSTTTWKPLHRILTLLWQVLRLHQLMEIFKKYHWFLDKTLLMNQNAFNWDALTHLENSCQVLELRPRPSFEVFTESISCLIFCASTSLCK